MDICFDCVRNTTRVFFDNVDYVEVDYAKVNGRITKMWYVYTTDGKTHTLKYKDNLFYWARP